MRSSHQTTHRWRRRAGTRTAAGRCAASSIGAVPTTAVMARADPAGAPAHDAVEQHEPDAEAGDLDQLEPVVVQPPQVHERRQQQRPAPRVGDRAERTRRVDDREPVVGDDLGDVAVEQAAGLAQVQREVVALVWPLRCSITASPAATATMAPRPTPLTTRRRRFVMALVRAVGPSGAAGSSGGAPRPSGSSGPSRAPAFGRATVWLTAFARALGSPSAARRPSRG